MITENNAFRAYARIYNNPCLNFTSQAPDRNKDEKTIRYKVPNAYRFDKACDSHINQVAEDIRWFDDFYPFDPDETYDLTICPQQWP